MSHLRAFAKKFGQQFSGLVERKKFTVFGTPSRELKEILDGFGATYLTHFGVFRDEG